MLSICNITEVLTLSKWPKVRSVRILLGDNSSNVSHFCISCEQSTDYLLFWTVLRMSVCWIVSEREMSLWSKGPVMLNISKHRIFQSTRTKITWSKRAAVTKIRNPDFTALSGKVPSTRANVGLLPAHYKRCGYPNLRVLLLELCAALCCIETGAWGPWCKNAAAGL